MVVSQIGNPLSVTHTTPQEAVDIPEAHTVEGARTALQSIDPGYYTDENLAHMTHNDLVYALRLHQTPESIK